MFSGCPGATYPEIDATTGQPRYCVGLTGCNSGFSCQYSQKLTRNVCCSQPTRMYAQVVAELKNGKFSVVSAYAFLSDCVSFWRTSIGYPGWAAANVFSLCTLPYHVSLHCCQREKCLLSTARWAHLKLRISIFKKFHPSYFRSLSQGRTPEESIKPSCACSMSMSNGLRMFYLWINQALLSFER